MSVIDSSFVFCPPPLGKPDPTQDRPMTGPDTRRRVIQDKVKDTRTCWFSVLNLIRNRYKAPNTEDLSDRKIEKIISGMRKQVRSYDISLPDICISMEVQIIEETLKSMTKSNVFSPENLEWIRLVDNQSEVKLSPLIGGFVRQNSYQNLYEYLCHFKFDRVQDIHLEFLKKLNVDVEQVYQKEKIYMPNLYQADHFTDLGQPMRMVFLDSLARRVSSERFGFKFSSWRPSQSIDSLIKELKEKGPLVIGGKFGKSHYSTPPENLNRVIADRLVYGWKKNVERVESDNAHAILLIGAEKQKKAEVVFYVDPADTSNPSNPEEQKVYCMSYKRLTSDEVICDHYGHLTNKSPFGYALYYPNNKKGI